MGGGGGGSLIESYYLGLYILGSPLFLDPQVFPEIGAFFRASKQVIHTLRAMAARGPGLRGPSPRLCFGGFKVSGLGCWALGCRVWGLGFRV